MTNPPKTVNPTRSGVGGILLALTLLGSTSFTARAATWDGDTAEALWSESDNWADGLPSGSDVVFGSTGRTGRATVGNIVDQSLTIRSLSYGVTSATLWQVTRINTGVTLTLQGSTDDLLSVGTTGTAAVSQAAIEGEGKLLLNQSDGDLIVSGRDTATPTSLDLSGLATFEATVGSLRVGSGRVNANAYRGTLLMAQSNQVTADNLLIASWGLGTQSSQIYYGEIHLGATNVWNIDQVDVGSNRGLGSLQFQEGVSNGTLVLQGKASTPETRTRANLNVGNTGGGSVNAQYGGTADLTGGEVDAYLDTLKIAAVTGNVATPMEGSFLMDAGVVDAVSVIIGQKTSSGVSTTGEVSGLLDIAGGRLTTQTLVMADQAGTLGSATAQLKIHGEGEVEVTQGGITMGTNGTTSTLISIEEDGKLSVAGAIAKGSGTTDATLRLQGGTLDLNGHAISVDSFQAEGGTLRNLGEVNGGADWSKTSGDTLILEGTHLPTGRLTVAAGTLLLEGSMAQANLTVHESAVFSMGEEAALQFNISNTASDQFLVQSGGSASFSGTFTFHLQPEIEAGTWSLLSGTAASDYAGLEAIALSGAISGSLQNIGSGIWQYNSGTWLTEFDTSTGAFSLTVVPEPSTWLLGSLAAGVLLLSRGRNPRRK